MTPNPKPQNTEFNCIFKMAKRKAKKMTIWEKYFQLDSEGLICIIHKELLETIKRLAT